MRDVGFYSNLGPLSYPAHHHNKPAYLNNELAFDIPTMIQYQYNEPAYLNNEPAFDIPTMSQY